MIDVGAGGFAQERKVKAADVGIGLRQRVIDAVIGCYALRAVIDAGVETQFVERCGDFGNLVGKLSVFQPLAQVAAKLRSELFKRLVGFGGTEHFDHGFESASRKQIVMLRKQVRAPLAQPIGAADAAVGDTVTWVNTDVLAHTATAADGVWDSGLLMEGDEWSLVIESAGRIGYACTPHPVMTDVINAQ